MALSPTVLALPLLVALQGGGLDGEWKRVTSKPGGFSVSLPPGKVEQNTSVQETDAGPAEVHLVMSETDGVVFVTTGGVNPSPATPELQDAYFAKVRGIIAGQGKTIQKEQKGTYNGMPMCYFRYASTGPNGQPYVVQARYMIGDGNRVYSASVIVPKGVNVDDHVRRYFQAFRKVEAVAVAKGKASGKPASKTADWKLFAPAGQGFSVAMPAEPKVKKLDPPHPSMTLDSYAALVGDRQYSVARFSWPATDEGQGAAPSLETMCTDVATGMKGTVVDSKKVRKSGLDAHEITFELTGPNGKPAVGRVRSFIEGTRAFVLLFNGPDGSQDDEDVDKFLDSFRTVKAAPSAKAKAKSKR